MQSSDPMYRDQHLSAFTAPAGTPGWTPAGKPAGTAHSSGNGVRHHMDPPAPAHDIRLSDRHPSSSTAGTPGQVGFGYTNSRPAPQPASVVTLSDGLADRLTLSSPDSAAHLAPQPRLMTQLVPSRGAGARSLNRQHDGGQSKSTARRIDSRMDHPSIDMGRHEDDSSGSDDSGDDNDDDAMTEGAPIEVLPLDPITSSRQLARRHVAGRKVSAARPGSGPASIADVHRADTGTATTTAAAVSVAADDGGGGGDRNQGAFSAFGFEVWDQGCCC